jgi:peptidoglycan/LPS O-acetylase OafA/YrhL
VRREAPTSDQRIQRSLAAAAALMALWAVVAVLAPRAPWGVRPLAAALLAALLYLAASSRAALTQRVLGRGPLVAVGLVSYSAYLYHLPLLALWGALVAVHPAALALAAYAVVLALVSWTSWRFVERPYLAGSGTPGLEPPSEPERAIVPRP